MPNPPRFDSAAQYREQLATNANFMEIYMRGAPGRPLDDLGLGQARRYFNGMWRAAREGREVRHLGELRGHVHTEHHTEGRRAGRRKPGYEDYTPPQRKKRGWYFQRNSAGERVAVMRETSGEREAERTIAQAARLRTTGYRREKRGGDVRYGTVPYRISVNVYGPPDASGNEQRARLFWKGGWYADQLAEAIGWKKTRGGWYTRSSGAKGLEKLLLDYMASLPEHAYGDRWGGILRYEIYAYPDPVREIAEPAGEEYVGPA